MAPNEHDQGKDRMEIDESEGGREGVGDGADAACPCIPGPRGPPPLRPRPNNVNDKADKAATMQPTSCYVTLTTSGEACLIKGQLKYI